MNIESFVNKWKPTNRRYLLVNSIGSGTFGTVAKAVDLYQQCFVAVKQLKHQRGFLDIYPTALQEIALLKEINHPNIVSYLDVCAYYLYCFRFV